MSERRSKLFAKISILLTTEHVRACIRRGSLSQNEWRICESTSFVTISLMTWTMSVNSWSVASRNVQCAIFASILRPNFPALVDGSPLSLWALIGLRDFLHWFMNGPKCFRCFFSLRHSIENVPQKDEDSRWKSLICIPTGEVETSLLRYFRSLLNLTISDIISKARESFCLRKFVNLLTVIVQFFVFPSILHRSLGINKKRSG